MRKGLFLLPVLVALAAAGCARQQQTYVIDPSTGQPVPVVMRQQQIAQPQYAQQSYQPPAPQAAASGERGLFNSWQSAPRPQYAQQTYAQQPYQPPAPQAAATGERGLFNSWQSAPRPQYAQQTYAQQPYQPPAPSSGRGPFTSLQSAPEAYVYLPSQQPDAMQNGAPQAQQYALPRNGGPYVAPPNGTASASLY